MATLHLFKGTTFYMTFAVIRADLVERRIEYATAGHPPGTCPSGRRARGAVHPNRPLGMDATLLDLVRPVGTASYAVGDTIVFTDGSTSVRDRGRRCGREARAAVLLSRAAPRR
jgi:serine phosphatase RsbU (regulator of sigma subunit)